jgi:hypothetical protein
MAGVTTIAVPWTSPVPVAVKGIIHVPVHSTPMTPSRRDILLIAIAKARSWVDELANGRVGSFAVLARREGKVERHIRLLAALAFLSPQSSRALLDGTAPAGSPSRRLLARCPGPGPSRSDALGCIAIDISPAAAPGLNSSSPLTGRVHVLTDA